MKTSEQEDFNKLAINTFKEMQNIFNHFDGSIEHLEDLKQEGVKNENLRIKQSKN